MALTIASGQVITADLWNALVPLRVNKGSAQTVTNSTVLVSDTELFLDLAAGRTYRIECVLGVSGPAAADVKLAWLRTGTINHVGLRNYQGPDTGTAGAGATTLRHNGGNALTTAVSYGTDGTNYSHIRETFEVECTVAGRLTLQWAQNTANVTGTVVNAASYLSATPVL